MEQKLLLGRMIAENADELRRLEGIFSELSDKHGVGRKELVSLIKERKRRAVIPASIFRSGASPLECVVRYMDGALKLSQTEIARILNRNHTTVWTTLDNARKKEMNTVVEEDDIFVPVRVFSDRRLSILESACLYLKDKHELRYHDIAVMLGKDDRTIWTVVNRAKKKIAGKR